MCYSLAATKGALIIHAVASCALVWQGAREGRRDMVVAGIVLAGIGTMQMAEYLMHLDPLCRDRIAGVEVNKLGSRMGYASLLLIQPIAGLLGLVLSGAGAQRTKYLLGLWLVAFVGNLALARSAPPAESDFCTKAKKCSRSFCSLDWPWDPWTQASKHAPWLAGAGWGMYFVATMAVPLLAIKQGNMIPLLAGAHIALRRLAPGTWTDAASCFWGPLAVYLLYLLDIPAAIN